MQKWEYQTQFLLAHIDNRGAKELLQQKWPKWQPRTYSPQTMIPELNELGEQGWEVVHMEPVNIGASHDVYKGVRQFFTGEGGFTNVYFCLLKRPKG